MDCITQTATTADTSPELWIGCLAAYNAGHLHGKWFKLADYNDASELRKAVKLEVLNTSPAPDAEEYAAMDNQGFPGGYNPGEYPDYAKLYEMIEQAEDLDDDVLTAALACSDDWEEACEMAQDRYAGHFRTRADFAEDLAEQAGDLDTIPPQYRNYIDWDSKGRDYILNGDVWEHDGHYFWTK